MSVHQQVFAMIPLLYLLQQSPQLQLGSPGVPVESYVKHFKFKAIFNEDLYTVVENKTINISVHKQF